MAKPLNIIEQEQLNKRLKETQKIREAIAKGDKIYAPTKKKLVQYEEEIAELQEKQAEYQKEKEDSLKREAKLAKDAAKALRMESIKKSKATASHNQLQQKVLKSFKSETGQMLKQLNLSKELQLLTVESIKANEEKNFGARKAADMMISSVMAAQDEIKNGTFEGANFVNDLREDIVNLDDIDATKFLDDHRVYLEGFVKKAEKAGTRISNALQIDKKELDGLEEYRTKFKRLSTMLMNPVLWGSVAIGLAVAGITKFVSSLMDFGNATGMAYKDLAKFGPEIVFAKEELQALLDETGSLNNIQTENVMQMKLLSLQYGVSAEASAKLSTQLMGISGSTRASALNTIKFTAQLARAEGVAPAKVMEEIAENTEYFATYAKDGGDNMIRAAIHAKKLGANLSTTAKMAEGLLDFESSMDKSLTATLLTGRDINLTKATELMLMGNQKGMMDEMLRIAGSSADFQKMNPIARKAMASAINLEVSELSKMLVNREILANMDDEEIRKAQQKEQMVNDISKA
jgi:hypothetical protein